MIDLVNKQVQASSRGVLVTQPGELPPAHVKS